MSILGNTILDNTTINEADIPAYLAMLEQQGVIAPDQRLYAPPPPAPDLSNQHMIQQTTKRMANTDPAASLSGPMDMGEMAAPQASGASMALQPSEETIASMTPSLGLDTSDLGDYAQQRGQLFGYALGQPEGKQATWRGMPIPGDITAMAQKVRGLIEPTPLQKLLEERMMGAFKNIPMNDLEPAKGFKGHMKAIGRALLMGEGIPGIFRGAFTPNDVNMRYRMAQLAPLVQGTETLDKMHAERIKNAGALADMIGYDPITGMRTPNAAYRDYLSQIGWGKYDQTNRRLDLQESRNQVYADWLRAKIQELKGRPDKERRQEIVRLVNSGAINDPEGLTYAAGELGIPDFLKPRFRTGNVRVNSRGEYFDVTTGVTIKDPDTQQPIKAFSATQLEEKQREFERSEGRKGSEFQEAEDRRRKDSEARRRKDIERDVRKANPPNPWGETEDEAKAREQKIQDEVNRRMSAISTGTQKPSAADKPIGPPMKSKSKGGRYQQYQRPDGTTYMRQIQ